MKCPSCSRSHRKSGGSRCACGYRFVFTDPSREGMSDHRFRAIINAATAGGTYYVTPRQLYSHYRHKHGPKKASRSFLLAVVVVPFGFLFPPVLLAALVAVGFGVYRLTHRGHDYPGFTRLLREWRGKGDASAIEKVIAQPRLGEPPPDWPEGDIYDYGVERLLIVERDTLVDLFVLNGQHAESRALVLAESGYPEYLVAKARELLETKADLPIFLLHDSTGSGMEMRARIEQGKLLPVEGHPIVDLGITPEDVGKLKRLACVDPKRHGNRVAVDLLPYAMLAGGLGLGFVSGTSLAAVMAKQAKGNGASGHDSSFG